jgi:hypothetical protein
MILRLLLSALGVFAMFFAGRMVRSGWEARRLPGKAGGSVGLKPVADLPAEPSEPKLLESIVIAAPAQEVYDHARRMEYFDRYLHSLTVDVIADQPGEFFGLRVEHNGELYGTVLLRFEEMPGRNAGTQASITSKLKHEMPPAQLYKLQPLIAQEIDTYLRFLKQECEGVLTS